MMKPIVSLGVYPLLLLLVAFLRPANAANGLEGVTTLYYVSRYPATSSTPKSTGTTAEASTITPAPISGNQLLSISEEIMGTTIVSLVESASPASGELGIVDVEVINSFAVEEFIYKSTTRTQTVLTVPVTNSLQLLEDASTLLAYVSPTFYFIPGNPKPTLAFGEFINCTIDTTKRIGHCVEADLVRLFGSSTAVITTNTRAAVTFVDSRGSSVLTTQTATTETFPVVTGFSTATTSYDATLVPFATLGVSSGARDGGRMVPGGFTVLCAVAVIASLM